MFTSMQEVRKNAVTKNQGMNLSSTLQALNSQ